MNIWIFNHYATNMFFEGAGRHHSLGKYLVRKGNKVSIFCANTVHGKEEGVDIESDQSCTMLPGSDNISYIFVKCVSYSSNGIDRIKNMYSFYKGLFKASNEYKKIDGKPDIILASSVHPLTLIAGLKIAKKYGIPCICEIRDLWPETLVELNIIHKNNILTKLMYLGEKWIYKRANGLIFTMPGGENYIKDKGWGHAICLEKVFHINNGVDLEKFNDDKANYSLEDVDLDNDGIFKIVYAGSIRQANKIDNLVEIAKIFNRRKISNIKLIIFGDGDQRERLENECKQLGLDNIVFKGYVKKQFIPYIVSKGDLNIVTDESNGLGKYGISWNKIFEYMASGKPTIVNYDMGEYNLVKDYNFGMAYQFESIENFADAVLNVVNIPEYEYKKYRENAVLAAKEYDYYKLADDLFDVLKTVLNGSWK